MQLTPSLRSLEESSLIFFDPFQVHNLILSLARFSGGDPGSNKFKSLFREYLIKFS